MNGFTEIHSHFIYGVDDGAKNRNDMYAMLDQAHANNITKLFATSHINPGFQPFDTQAFLHHLEEAYRYCIQQQYAIALYDGAEILYNPLIERYASEHLLPTLGNTHTILMEFLPDVAYSEIEKAIVMMERNGYNIILAHIERYNCLSHVKNVMKLKENYNVLFQVNCSTLLKKQSIFQRMWLHKLLRHKIIDFIASDAHNVHSRPYCIRDAYEWLTNHVDQSYADALVHGERKIF